MKEDNVTRFPGRRDRVLGVLVAIQVTLTDAHLAFPSVDYVAKVKHDACQVRALHEGDADSVELLDAIDAAMAALSALAGLGENCSAALKVLNKLIFRLAATPDEPRGS